MVVDTVSVRNCRNLIIKVNGIFKWMVIATPSGGRYANTTETMEPMILI